MFVFMTNQKEDILAKFLDNESKIEKLYKLYSQKFPSHREIWIKLLIKKRHQIEILKDLSLRLDRYDLFKVNSHAPQILNYVSNFIDEQIKKIKLDNLVLHDALGVALSLERSLKEKDSLKLLESKHEDVFKTFKILNHQTSQQVNILYKAYNKIA